MRNGTTIVIVGNGVAANVLGHALRHDGRTRASKLIQVACDQTYPPCSLRSTAHCCLRNTQTGISPLGDQLVAAYKAFVAHYERYVPDGVFPCTHVHLWRGDSHSGPRLVRRYAGVSYTGDRVAPLARALPRPFEMASSDAFVIEPKHYLDHLVRATAYDEIIQDAVLHVAEQSIRLASYGDLLFDTLFLCTGQYTSRFRSAFVDADHLDRSKPVAGTCLAFDLDDFDGTELAAPEQAFCLDVEDVHLVYRPIRRQVLLGSTTTSGSDSTVHDEAVYDLYDKVRTCLRGTLTLPAASRATPITGVRHKGPGRQAFWGPVSKNVYAVYGLYKSAFVTAHLAARQLIETLTDTSRR